MIIEIPTYESDQLPDDSKSKAPTHESTALFHWPPGCLWPFMDRRSEGDT
jgi:hypothetical protein